VLGAGPARASLRVYAGDRRVAELLSHLRARNTRSRRHGNRTCSRAPSSRRSRVAGEGLVEPPAGSFHHDLDLVSAELDELESASSATPGALRLAGQALARRRCALPRRRDGHESLVRRQLGLEFPEAGPADHFAVFEFEVAEAVRTRCARAARERRRRPLAAPRRAGAVEFAVDPRATRGLRRRDHEPVQIIGAGAIRPEEAYFHDSWERAPWFQAKMGTYMRIARAFERRRPRLSGTGASGSWASGPPHRRRHPEHERRPWARRATGAAPRARLRRTDIASVASRLRPGTPETEWRQLLGRPWLQAGPGTPRRRRRDSPAPSLPARVGEALAALAQRPSACSGAVKSPHGLLRDCPACIPAPPGAPQPTAVKPWFCHL